METLQTATAPKLEQVINALKSKGIAHEIHQSENCEITTLIGFEGSKDVWFWVKHFNFSTTGSEDFLAYHTYNRNTGKALKSIRTRLKIYRVFELRTGIDLLTL